MILTALLSIFLTLTANPESLQNNLWRVHSSAYDKTNKISDSENGTFFLMYSTYAGSSVPHIPFADLFYAEKNGKTPEILPANKKWELSSNNITILEYNPWNDYHVAVSADGYIDILYPDGSSKPVSSYSNLNIPYNKTINGVSFHAPSHSVYLATGFGYAIINDITGDIQEIVNLNKPINQIIRCGETLYVRVDKNIYSSDAGLSSFKLDDSSRIRVNADIPGWLDSNSSPDKAEWILPLSDKGFVIVNALSASSFTASVVWQSDTELLNAIQLFSDNLSQNAKPLVSALEGSVSYTAEGVLFNAQKKLYLLDKSTELPSTIADAPQYISSSLRSITKPSELSNAPAASWNAEEVWFFNPFYDFTIYSYSGSDLQLRDKEIHPHVSRYGICSDLISHPQYGLLTLSCGPSRLYTNTSGYMPCHISGYMESVWTPYAPNFYNAEFLPSISSTSWNNTWRYTYPGLASAGFAVDPMNPDHVYVGSIFDGLMRYDLKNPQNRILRLVQQSNQRKSFTPGTVKAFENNPSTPSQFRIAWPDFDTDNNLWAVNFNIGATNEMRLLCWPAEQRMASANAHFNPSEFYPPALLAYENISSGNYNRLYVLKHASNAGKLAYTTGIYGNPLFIIDTGRTPLDQSDDTIIPISEDLCTDQSGNRYSFVNIYDVYEDSETGEIWVGGDHGLFYFTLDEVLSGKGVHTPQSARRGNMPEDITGGYIVTSITRDEQRRMWIGTSGGGVLCFSSDLSQQLGHWHTDCSSLPDNCILNLCWDNNSHSVFAATSKGLAQLILPETLNDTVEQSVFATPSTILPKYQGYISVQGLKPDMSYDMVNMSGNLRLTVGKTSAGGQLQIHIPSLKHMGIILPPDRYYLHPSEDASLPDAPSSILRVL